MTLRTLSLDEFLRVALNDQDIHSAAQIRAVLGAQIRAVLGALAAFRSPANDAGDLFSHLTTPIESAQKED